MFEIIIDATSDLEEKYKKKTRVVPLYIIDTETNRKIPVTTDYSVFYDDDDLIKKWHEGKLRTSQPSIEDFMKAIRESEYDEILILTISSKLSGTYNVAVNASKKSNKKVLVFDTLSASIGAGLYIKKAIEMREKGYNIDDVLNELKKISVKLYLITDDIKYLLNNGRISKLKYAFLKLTKLVPILTEKDGSLELLRLSKAPIKDLEKLEADLEETIWASTKGEMDIIKNGVLGSPIVAVNAGPAYGLAGLSKSSV